MTKPAIIAPNQHWTFVHPDGERVGYIVESAEGAEHGDQRPSSIVKIVNQRTRGVGWVTTHWMRRPDDYRAGHFEYEQTMAEQIAA